MKKIYSVLFYSFTVLLAICFIFSSTEVKAQGETSANTKYFRIDIGHGGLHCPFLGPQLQKKINELQGIANLQWHKQESFATFELPATSAVSDAEVKQVAMKVGYPENDVIVVVSDAAPIQQE